MKLENFRIYKLAGEIADDISLRVAAWSSFHRETLGKQTVRAADSIGNNISESLGRSSTAEKLNFLFIADGSLQELKNQVQRAYGRDLITEEDCEELQHQLRRLSISIIEFCNAILERDETYTGRYRDIVAKRRKWLLEYYAKLEEEREGNMEEETESETENETETESESESD